MDELIPSIEELERERIAHGITKQRLGEAAGCGHSAWGQAVEKQSASRRFRMNVMNVLLYYDIYGIIPKPGEVQAFENGPRKSLSIDT
jgi:hypothetical protein